jgi:hypothetical protein
LKICKNIGKKLRKYQVRSKNMKKKFEKKGKKSTTNPWDEAVVMGSMPKIAGSPRVLCALDGMYGLCAANLVVAAVVGIVEVLAATVVELVVAVGYGSRAAATIALVSAHRLARDATGSVAYD